MPELRVVSLVPSLTHTLFSMGLGPDQLVGRSAFCVLPEPQVREIKVVGGTKTPRLRLIESLAPDLVVLDVEENRRETAEALEALGLEVWASRVSSLAHVPGMLEALGARVRQEEGARLAQQLHGAMEEARERSAALGPGPVALPLIWNKPLMGLSPTRYGGDILKWAGFRVPDPEPGVPYPALTPRQIGELGVELLLLSSEPHDFTEQEGERIAAAVEAEGFVRPAVLKIDGQALTWFGALSEPALRWWLKLRERSA